MIQDDDVIIWDGDDIIVKTYNFNIYSDKFKIENFLGFSFDFTVERNSPEGTPDIQVTGDGGKKASVVLSSKVRGYLAGGGTTQKMELTKGPSSKLLFSIFAQRVGEKADAMNICLTFYQRKV